MSSRLEGAEAVLRTRGPAEIPDGLAERAARAALAASPQPAPFAAQLVAVAWRAAAVSVAIAVALAVLTRFPGPGLQLDAEDPALELTALPEDVADPTYGLLGSSAPGGSL